MYFLRDPKNHEVRLEAGRISYCVHGQHNTGCMVSCSLHSSNTELPLNRRCQMQVNTIGNQASQPFSLLCVAGDSWRNLGIIHFCLFSPSLVFLPKSVELLLLFPCSLVQLLHLLRW